jgi:hypothetical protein
MRVDGLVLLFGKRPVDQQRLPRLVLKARSACHYALVCVPWSPMAAVADIIWNRRAGYLTGSGNTGSRG